jgi:hypothetical protein
MRSALRGGSEGTTGTATAGNVNTKILTEIQHHFRWKHRASFRSTRTNRTGRKASDAMNLAGRPDTWLNRSSTLRRRKQDSVTVTLSRRMREPQPLFSSRVEWCLGTVRRRGQSHSEKRRGTYGSSLQQRACLQANGTVAAAIAATRFLRYCPAPRQALRPTGSPSDILGPRLSSK